MTCFRRLALICLCALLCACAHWQTRPFPVLTTNRDFAQLAAQQQWRVVYKGEAHALQGIVQIGEQRVILVLLDSFGQRVATFTAAGAIHSRLEAAEPQARFTNSRLEAAQPQVFSTDSRLKAAGPRALRIERHKRHPVQPILEPLWEALQLSLWPAADLRDALAPPWEIRTGEGRREIFFSGILAAVIAHESADPWQGVTRYNNYRHGFQLTLESRLLQSTGRLD